jgi:hypothetical protein
MIGCPRRMSVLCEMFDNLVDDEFDSKSSSPQEVEVLQKLADAVGEYHRYWEHSDRQLQKYISEAAEKLSSSGDNHRNRKEPDADADNR